MANYFRRKKLIAARRHTYFSRASAWLSALADDSSFICRCYCQAAAGKDGENQLVLLHV